MDFKELEELISLVPEPPDLTKKMAEISAPEERGPEFIAVALVHLMAFKGEIEGYIFTLDGLKLRSGQDWDKTAGEPKKQFLASFLPQVQASVDAFTVMNTLKLQRQSIKVASEGVAAAKESSEAANTSLKIARRGTILTRIGVGVAAISAVISSGALLWQIYNQGKSIDVQLASPVSLQAVTLTSESIKSLGDAIVKAELERGNGKPVSVILDSSVQLKPITLSPESIDGLSMAVAAELERRKSAIASKDQTEAGQKAN
ncbi:hypothetical protein [Microbulbifer sp. PSTR4-B]|uniref:hypothetical protein n=1 Tax=unclassified Microbulbifer TaxID=2619833 RepID=UPI004039EC3F